ncbi:Nn.00g046880.m01.CDS01 [Neocucurbitaria sp. VM-36]
MHIWPFGTRGDTPQSRNMRSEEGNKTSDCQNSQGLTHESTQVSQHPDQPTSDLASALHTRDEECRKLQVRISELESDNHKLQRDYARLGRGEAELEHRKKFYKEHYWYLLKKLVKPYTDKRDIPFESLTEESSEEVINLLQMDAMQAISLRSQNKFFRTQISQLQSDLLAKVDKMQTISDDQFRQHFRSLASSIKSFSRSIQVMRQCDAIEPSNQFVLLKQVASQHWNIRARKKKLVEAWVWSILLALVFKNPFELFGEHYKSLQGFWKHIFGVQHSHNWPRPSSQCESWRYKTVELLVDLAGRDTIAQGTDQQTLEGLKGSVVETRRCVKTFIEREFRLTEMLEVDQIVDKSFALAMQMYLQRSRLQITYPHVRAPFNRDRMTSVSEDEDDDEDMEFGVVAFVITPGLAKWGDAHGENFDQRYDVVPSLVQLEPTKIKHELEINGQRDMNGRMVVDGQPNISGPSNSVVCHGAGGEPEWQCEADFIPDLDQMNHGNVNRDWYMD